MKGRYNMTDRTRINVEIADEKLHSAIKKLAKKERRTIKALTEIALWKYVKETV